MAKKRTNRTKQSFVRIIRTDHEFDIPKIIAGMNTQTREVFEEAGEAVALIYTDLVILGQREVDPTVVETLAVFYDVSEQLVGYTPLPLEISYLRELEATG